MPDGRTLTRIIASLVGALGAAALSLDRYDVVKLSRRSVVAAIAAVALGTAGAAIAEVFLDRSGVRRLKFERDVRQQLRSAIASTATRQKDAWEHVRASLYRIERSSWRPWTQRKLVRRLDEHLLLAPAPSEPKWKRGEGVVGKGWATQGDQHGAQSGEELLRFGMVAACWGWFRWLRRQSTPQTSPLKPRTKLLGWRQPR